MYAGPFVRSYLTKTFGYLERGWVGQQYGVGYDKFLKRSINYRIDIDLYIDNSFKADKNQSSDRKCQLILF